MLAPDREDRTGLDRERVGLVQRAYDKKPRAYHQRRHFTTIFADACDGGEDGYKAV